MTGGKILCSKSVVQKENPLLPVYSYQWQHETSLASCSVLFAVKCDVAGRNAVSHRMSALCLRMAILSPAHFFQNIPLPITHLVQKIVMDSHCVHNWNLTGITGSRFKYCIGPYDFSDRGITDRIVELAN